LCSLLIIKNRTEKQSGSILFVRDAASQEREFAGRKHPSNRTHHECCRADVTLPIEDVKILLEVITAGNASQDECSVTVFGLSNHLPPAI